MDIITRPQDVVSTVGFVVFVGAAPRGCPTVYRGNVLYKKGDTKSARSVIVKM